MKVRIAALVGSLLFAGSLALIPAAVWASEEGETSELLIKLVKLGRGVVSEHQDLINDASKSGKGFTGDFLAAQVAERFRNQTKIDLSRGANLPQQNVLLSLLEAEKEVVDDAQVVINKQGVGFKGFLPAIFARKTGERFYKKTGIRIKLTGNDYRNPNNRPDEFESDVLRLFSDARHPKGQQYAKATMLNGKPVYRLMDPEYATTSCLSCHGNPKGERDVTGMRKEGWKEGDLAGALSVVYPMR
ncbi:MAG: DUF3365 domain-containing protein [Nitrospiraceae bacterium]